MKGFELACATSWKPWFGHFWSGFFSSRFFLHLFLPDSGFGSKLLIKAYILSWHKICSPMQKPPVCGGGDIGRARWQVGAGGGRQTAWLGRSSRI